MQRSVYGIILTKNQTTECSSLTWEKLAERTELSCRIDTVGSISALSITNAFQFGDHVQSIIIVMIVTTGSSFVCFVYWIFSFPSTQWATMSSCKVTHVFKNTTLLIGQSTVPLTQIHLIANDLSMPVKSWTNLQVDLTTSHEQTQAINSHLQSLSNCVLHGLDPFLGIFW